MKIKEIISEAAMSVGIQSRYPVSPGARGLMGARWRYDRALENSSNDLDKSAVEQLEFNLRNIPKIDYDHIDILMKHIGEKFRVEPAKLHKDFVQKYNCTPDDYAVKYKKSRIDKPIQI